MRFFRWHLLLILFWILFQMSFLDILLPDVKSPVALLALLVSMSMVFSLDQAFGLAILSVFLFDISRAGTITPFFFFVFPVVLVTSYVAERFFPENPSLIRPQALLFFMLVVILSEILFPFFSWPRWWDLLVGILLFPLVLFSVYQLEEWLRSSSMLEFRGLRQTK